MSHAITTLMFLALAQFKDLPLEKALLEAGDYDRMVMIDFVTEDCAPCRLMEADTWSFPRVQRWLEENVVAIRIDGGSSADVAREYRVTTYPSMAFIRPDGKRYEVLIGYMDASQFLVEAQAVLDGTGPIKQLQERSEVFAGDVPERLYLIDDLMKYGLYEDALRHLQWCWDGAESSEGPLYPSARRTAVLRIYAELAKAYAKAYSRLTGIRDSLAVRFREGKGSIDDAWDLVAINRALGEEANTLNVLDSLPSCYQVAGDGASVRSVIGRGCLDQLRHAKRYQEILALLGNYSVECRSKLSALIKAERSNGGSGRDAIHFAIGDGAGQYYEALLAAGHEAAANEMCHIILEADNTYATCRLLLEYAVGSSSSAGLDAFLRLAETSLSAREAKALRSEARAANGGRGLGSER